jgi:hypothetical protein
LQRRLQATLGSCAQPVAGGTDGLRSNRSKVARVSAIVLQAALTVGAILALVVGYAVNRWRVVPVLAAIGIVAIVVDISARDLTTAGHDDRGVVAFAEAALLLGILVLFAVGVGLRRWRDRHRWPSAGNGVT